MEVEGRGRIGGVGGREAGAGVEVGDVKNVQCIGGRIREREKVREGGLREEIG